MDAHTSLEDGGIVEDDENEETHAKDNEGHTKRKLPMPPTQPQQSKYIMSIWSPVVDLEGV